MTIEPTGQHFPHLFAPITVGTMRLRNRVMLPPHASAIGNIYGPVGSRGLFKTADGGKTWTKLTEGLPNINVVIKAFRDQAISIAEDGTIHLFGIYLPSGWDTVRIRRKVEDHLRKISSTEEIIRIASCLGVRLSETVR